MKRKIDDGKGAFIAWLKQNALQFTMQIFAVLIVLLNMWLVNKLAPLTKSVDTNSYRIEAIEKRNDDIDPLVSRFLQLEERDNYLQNDISEIKSDVKDIKNQLYGR